MAAGLIMQRDAAALTHRPLARAVPPLPHCGRGFVSGRGFGGVAAGSPSPALRERKGPAPQAWEGEGIAAQMKPALMARR
jgi:hypothetical protein